jgi:apolipoprotein N-acyltransferase
MSSKYKLIGLSAILGVLSHICGDLGVVFMLVFGVVIFAVFFSILDKKEINEKIMMIIVLAGVFLVSGMIGNLIRVVLKQL